jgi:hypothetical protein
MQNDQILVFPDRAGAPVIGIDKPNLRNFTTERVGDGFRRVAKRAEELRQEIEHLTEGWPRRIGQELFVKTQDGDAATLKTHADLFAWLHGVAHVESASKQGLVPKGEFCASMRSRIAGSRPCPTSPPWIGSTTFTPR